MTTSAYGGIACISGVSRDCGHGIFRLEGGATRSQIKRATNCAIPGYLILNHYSTKFVRLKDFSVCGHLCGQSRFYGVFDNRRKSRKHRCHKALRRFTLPRPDTATALPKQARYQLRYTRILNDLMGMAPPEQRADAHCTRYPCIITHRRQKGKRILIRFSLPGKLSLDIIKNDNIFVK